MKRKGDAHPQASDDKRKKTDAKTKNAKTQSQLFSMEETLNLLKEDVKFLKKTVDDLEDDADDPDHLPDLILRIDKGICRLVCWSVACFLLQIVQMGIVFQFLATSSFASLEDIDFWVRDGLLEWNNDTTRGNYPEDGEIDVLKAFKMDELATTEKGFTTSLRNIVFGVGLLLCFHISELNAVFYDNQYHLGMNDKSDIPRLMAAWVILLMQVVVASWVILAAARSVLTNSLDTVSTIEAALNAFFILEIDDKLLPVMWTYIKENVTKRRHRQDAIELHQVWNGASKTKKEEIQLPCLAIAIVAVVLALRGLGIMVLDAIQILDKSRYPWVEFVFDIWWVLITAFLGHIAMQLLRGHFYCLFFPKEGTSRGVHPIRSFLCVLVMIGSVYVANHQSPFSEWKTLCATTAAFYPVVMKIPQIENIHQGIWKLAFGKESSKFKQVSNVEAAIWFFLTAALIAYK